MAENEAQFTQVLELQLKVAEFTKGLQNMVRDYDAALTKMEARAKSAKLVPTVADGGNLGFEKALKSLEEALSSLDQHNQQVMTSLTETMLETTDKNTLAIDRLAAKLESLGVNTGLKKTAEQIRTDGASVEKAIQDVGIEVDAANEKLNKSRKRTPFEKAEIEKGDAYTNKQAEAQAALKANTDAEKADLKAIEIKQQVTANLQKELAKQAEVKEKADRKDEERTQAELRRKSEADKADEKSLQARRQVTAGLEKDLAKRTQAAVENAKVVESSEQRVQRVIAEISGGLANQTSISTLPRTERAEVLKNVLGQVKDDKFDVRTMLSQQNLRYIDEFKDDLHLKTDLLQGEVTRFKAVLAGNRADEAYNKSTSFTSSLGKLSNDAKKAADTYEAALRKLGDAHRNVQNELGKLADLKEANAPRNDIAKQGILVGEAQKVVTENSGKAKSALNSFNKELEDTGPKVNKAKGFLESLGSNLSGTIGHVIKFAVAWRLANAAISVFTFPFKLLEAFIHEVQEGAQYLEVLQNRSADVKEALIENVTFSNSMATNFKLAGDAADFTTRKIQEASAKFAIDAEKIEASFKSLVQGGGLAQVNNDLSRAVTLTGNLISALRARGVSDTNQRRAVTEINDLMTGQVKRGNAILQVLGYTREEWKKIHAEALKNGNLDDIIQNRLEAVGVRLATIEQRWTDITHVVTLYKNEVFAAIAQGTFNELLGILQQIKHAYEEHREEILNVAHEMGKVIALSIELGKPGNLDGFIGGLKLIANMLVRISTAISQTVNAFGALKKIWDAEGVHALDDVGKALEDAQKANDRLQREAVDFSTTLNDPEKALQDKVKARSAAYDLEVKKIRDKYTEISKGEANSQKELSEGVGKELTGIKLTKEQQLDALSDIAQLRSKLNAQYGVGTDPQEAALNKRLQQVKDDIDRDQQRLSDARKLNDEAEVKRLRDTAIPALQKIKNQVSEELNKAGGAPTIIANRPQRPPEESVGGKFRGQLEQELAEIKEAHEAQVQDVQRAETQKILSISQSTKQIIDIRRIELRESLDAIERYKTAVRNSNLQEGQKTTAIELANAKESKLRQANNRENSDQEQRLLQEKNAVQLTFSKARLQAIKDNAAAELRVEEQQAQQGYLTQVQLQDKKLQNLKVTHDASIQEILAEAAEAGNDEKARAGILTRLDAENRVYNNSVKEQTNERIRLGREEILALQAFAAAKREENLKALELDTEQSNQFAASTSQVEANNLKLAQARISNLSILEQEKQAELNAAKARNADTAETRKLVIELESLKNARRAAQNEAINAVANAPRTFQQLGRVFASNDADTRVKESAQKIEELSGELSQLNSVISLQRNAQGELTGATNAQRQKQQDLIAQLEVETQKHKDLGAAADRVHVSFHDVVEAIEGAFLGSAISDFEHAQGGLQKFAAGLEGAVNVLSSVAQLVGVFQQGVQQGGTLGGIGAVASQIGSQIPGIAGAIIQGVGSVFSFIGGIMRAQARRIANQVTSEIKEINRQYQLGQTSLSQTIDQLNSERQSAINRLSGKKGGSDELKKILPEIDQELDQLRKQASEIKTRFQDAVLAIGSGGEATQAWVASFIDMNAQVKEYLGALSKGEKEANGYANAALFLQANLNKQRQQLQDSYNDGEKQAIQDALDLNDLKKQQLDLEKQIAALKGVDDAIERRQVGAIKAAQDQAAQRKDLEDQLANVNEQIKVQQVKVDLESKLFGLSTDIAALHREDERLQLYTLDEQIKKYTEIATLLGSSGGTQYSKDFLRYMDDKGFWLGKTPMAGGYIPGVDFKSLFPNFNPNNKNINGSEPFYQNILGGGLTAGGGLPSGGGGYTAAPAIAPQPIRLPGFGTGAGGKRFFDADYPVRRVTQNTGATVQQLNVNINGTYNNPQQAGATIATEINRRLRYGYSY